MDEVPDAATPDEFSSDGSADDTADGTLDESIGNRSASSQQAPNNDPAGAVNDAFRPSNSPRRSATMQKRRRVTRACDECRRKKIKCDGKQPCTHCTVYSYDCTYDQPSNRRRNPGPHYVEALERRLRRAEQLLREVMPGVNLDDPEHDSILPPRTFPAVKLEGQPPSTGMSAQLRQQPSFSQPAAKAEEDSLLESMVHEAGSLNLDDQGHWDFYGHSSGMIFLKRMREQFGNLLGKSDATSIFMKSSIITGRLNSPKSPGRSSMSPGFTSVHDLPAKKCAKKLCSYALDDAAALLRFVHQPSFYAMFDRIYDTSPEHFTSVDQRFLPFLYAVLALGCLFAKAEESVLQSFGYESATDQGYCESHGRFRDHQLLTRGRLKWFQISRELMDVSDCRDLMSLRIKALLFMIMFLQASAKLSTCFSHIGIALRSAIRMGLHRSVPNQFSPIEQETRKRTFWVIRNMDIYVGALLGLPMMLSNEDIDQELPLEADDAYITETAVLPMPAGMVSVMVAFNAQVRNSESAFVVSHAKIREVERDLQRWMEDLPMALKPGGDAPPNLIRIQQLLRMSYGHVQMLLYRPFLHYASQSTQARTTDKRSYACAAACVSVSRNIIHITSEMKRRDFLIGAYWFSMYTTFFAVLSLLFYVIENPHNTASQGILKDAHEGRDTLASLAPRSMAADRSSQTLEGLFSQLPEALRSGRLDSLSQNKRPAPVHNPSTPGMKSAPSMVPSLSGVQSPADVTKSSSGIDDTHLKRASRTYSSPVIPHQPTSNLGSAFRQNPQPVFSPAPPNPIGFQHSPPPAGGVPSSGAQATIQSLDTSQISGFTDLSTMMFPSNDPFAYPNQPMTMFENLHDSRQDPQFNLPMFNNGSDREIYNSLNTPFYGPLPSYVMPSTHGSPGAGVLQSAEESITLPAQEWNQQPPHGRFQRPPTGSSWDTVFGEDWSGGGWTNQGYRQ
ncbi:MAG: hypothetical protein Q9185_003150 [Variospora sp. 1 TL-2023]